MDQVKNIKMAQLLAVFGIITASVYAIVVALWAAAMINEVINPSAFGIIVLFAPWIIAFVVVAILLYIFSFKLLSAIKGNDYEKIRQQVLKSNGLLIFLIILSVLGFFFRSPYLSTVFAQK